MVATGQVVGDQYQLVGYGLESVALTAHQFKHIRVFFMGHNAGTSGKLIRKGDKIEVLAHIQTDVHRHFGQGGGNTAHSKGCCLFYLATAHLCGHHIVFHGFKAHFLGGKTTVYREGTSITGGTTQGILVCYLIGGIHKVKIVYQTFGIGGKPESKGRGHGNLQVCIARQHHLLMLVRQI